MTKNQNIYRSRKPIGDGWKELRVWLYSPDAEPYLVIEKDGFTYLTDPTYVLGLFSIDPSEKKLRKLNNMLTYRFKPAPLVADRVREQV
jgi:hypothetical protein